MISVFPVRKARESSLTCFRRRNCTRAARDWEEAQRLDCAWALPPGEASGALRLINPKRSRFLTGAAFAVVETSTVSRLSAILCWRRLNPRCFVAVSRRCPSRFLSRFQEWICAASIPVRQLKMPFQSKITSWSVQEISDLVSGITSLNGRIFDF
jgi:hypothetical protein